MSENQAEPRGIDSVMNDLEQLGDQLRAMLQLRDEVRDRLIQAEIDRDAARKEAQHLRDRFREQKSEAEVERAAAREAQALQRRAEAAREDALGQLESQIARTEELQRRLERAQEESGQWREKMEALQGHLDQIRAEAPRLLPLLQQLSLTDPASSKSPSPPWPGVVPAPSVAVPSPELGKLTNGHGGEVGAPPNGFSNERPDLPRAQLADLLRDVKVLAAAPLDRALLGRMLERIYDVSKRAAAMGSRAVFNLASALEALMRDLHDAPERIDGRSLETVEEALNRLAGIMEDLANGEPVENGPSIVRGIERDAGIRGHLTEALASVNLRPVWNDDPERVSEPRSDLILIGRESADFDPHTLLARLRQSRLHERTPVIVVADAHDLAAPGLGDECTERVSLPMHGREFALRALLLTLRPQLEPQV